jgi:23S rRNA (cytidine2498-2'-O)-methyltransferase
MAAPEREALVVAHCRPGFEAEAAQDLAAIAERARFDIACEAAPRSALVVAQLTPFDARRWLAALRNAPPMFVRAQFHDAVRLDLPGADRIGPVLAALSSGRRFGSLWIEHPDSDDGRTLSGLARRLAPLLEARLVAAGALRNDAHGVASPKPLASGRPGGAHTRLHVLFTARDSAFVGVSDPAHDTRWPMGIARLRMPPGAPSRSTLKLAEALLEFLGDDEPQLVRPGMRAVDLGAAPGGWSWQLAYRGLRVTAIDNGPLKGAAAQDSLITHLREDGLTWHPRRPVDWMTCDIVEKPARIATLVARWIAMGDARRSIFNLKLPMKRRYEEVLRCRAIIEDTLAKAGVRHTLTMRQLYHDREEITGYLARID